ncbi:MAG: OsmC family peroxiredoxin [Chloroflexi bacterium]|jgi:osmotically inducible protein OsmC|nr:OsmC family peroxiredoxin [Chloroflexota bacterium]
MIHIQRTAESEWHGDSRSGQGTITTGSGVFHGQPYTRKMRFEDEPGTNPEELVAAAHAACYCMALASRLSKAGFTADRLHAKATLSVQQEDIGWTATRMRLEVEGVVPGIDAAAFQQYAMEAKDTCPISRLLAPGLQSIDLTAVLRP